MLFCALTQANESGGSRKQQAPVGSTTGLQRTRSPARGALSLTEHYAEHSLRMIDCLGDKSYGHSKTSSFLLVCIYVKVPVASTEWHIRPHPLQIIH